MADTDELKRMVSQFRCSELQVLLGFAGRSKNGKKQELLTRALDLVKTKSTPIHMKVRELYNKNIRTQSDTESNSTGSSTSSSSNMNPYLSGLTSGGRQNYQATNLISLTPQLDYGRSAHGVSVHSTNYPINPDVRFKRLPFFDIVNELLKPSSLVLSSNQKFQESNFVFHLTPQQANDLALSRDTRPGVKIEYGLQVQMRFCLLETSCPQEDNFPPSIVVKINGKMCALPNPIPTNKPGVEPKRPSRPVNITPYCKLCPTVANVINVSWTSDYGRAYVIGIYLVNKLSSTTLLQRLRNKGVRNGDHTRALIKEKLQCDADSEIATTSLRVSLMCPLGKMRMTVPCRATTCNHVQCFDAHLYLQMNEKKPTWNCPVCDKASLYDNLAVDGLFTEIYQKAPSDCNEIEFQEDGTWQPHKPKNKDNVTVNSVATPKAAAKPAPAPISISSNPNSPAVVAKTDATAVKPADKPKAVVVDLTLSDDDEADPAPAKKQATATNNVVSRSAASSTSTASTSSTYSTNYNTSALTLGSTLRGDGFCDMPILDMPSTYSGNSTDFYRYPNNMANNLSSYLPQNFLIPSLDRPPQLSSFSPPSLVPGTSNPPKSASPDIISID